MTPTLTDSPDVFDAPDRRIGYVQFALEVAVADLAEQARTNPELIDPSGLSELADSLNTLAAWLATTH